ncbi:MAG TPA: hypothetical protein VFS40_10525 [Gemmatimonadales bacterium]|nr:hypothetical protein [Gemmatimonadales bacterium]
MIPELGSSLGRLAEPPETVTPLPTRLIPTDDLRLELVTRLFELAGAARAFGEGGDRGGAVQSLARPAWIRLWEDAVARVAARLVEAVNARLRAAASESRLPERKLRTVLLGEEETRAVAARLGAAGAPLVASLDALERTAPGALRGPAGEAPWRDALLTAARRLESAWNALERLLDEESRYWLDEVARVRAWRRPVWPLAALSAVVLALAVYLGLVLGGYLAAPAPLAGFVEWWWERLG